MGAFAPRYFGGTTIVVKFVVLRGLRKIGSLCTTKFTVETEEHSPSIT